MHSNTGKEKIIKTSKVDNTKPKYKPDDKKHVWQRSDEKRKLS